MRPHRRRHRSEAGAVGVHPDPRDLLLFADEDGFGRASQDDRDIRLLVGQVSARIKDRTEQQQLGAREAVYDVDPALRDVGHEFRRCSGKQKRSDQQEERTAQSHSGWTVKISSGRHVSPSAMRNATVRTMKASRSRRYSGLIFWAKRAAELRPCHAADQQKRCQHDIHRLGGERMGQGRGDGHEQDLEQRRAHHDAGRHAQQIDHRRDQNEAAADAHQRSHDARREAEPERRERRDIQSRPVETPSARQCGDERMMAAGLGLDRFAAMQCDQAGDSLLGHRDANPAEQDDIQHGDDHIDLAAGLKDLEDEAAEYRADRDRRRPAPHPSGHRPRLWRDGRARPTRWLR